MKRMRWRKLFVCLAMVMGVAMAVAMGLGSWVTPAQAFTLNLKAVWNPNPEPDIGGYRIYMSEPNSMIWFYWNTATWLSVTGTIDTSNQGTLLPLAPQQLLFATPAYTGYPDVGWIDFALKAFDTNTNMSLKATTRYNYNVDVTPPAAPIGLTVTKQP